MIKLLWEFELTGAKVSPAFILFFRVTSGKIDLKELGKILRRTKAHFWAALTDNNFRKKAPL